jgi:hypothetical protein
MVIHVLLFKISLMLQRDVHDNYGGEEFGENLDQLTCMHG